MDPDTLYSCNGNSNYGKVSTISCHGTGCSQCGAYYADVCGAASNCPHTSPGFINYVKNNLPPDPICQAIQKAGYSGDVCGAYLPSGIGADPNSLYNCDSGVLALPIACGIAGCKQSGKANSSDTCVNGTPSGQNNQITVTPSTVTINCDPTKHTCGTAAVTASSSVAVIIPSCIINPPHEVLTSNNQLMLTFQGNYQNEFPNFNPCQMRFIATGNPTLTITFNVTHTNNYSCNTTGNGFTGLTSGHSSGTCATWAKCDTSKLAGDAVPCTHLPTCSNYSNWASLPGVSKIGHCEIPNFVGPVGNCQSGLGYSGSSDKQECGSTPGLGDNMCCNDTATDTGPVPPWVTTGTVLMASRVLSASTSAVPATTKPTQFPTILSFYPANLAESTKSNLLANVLAAQVYAAKDTLTYDPKTGYFVNPKFNTNTIPPGNYKVFVHVDKYLDAQLLQSDGSDTFNQQIGSPLSPKVANITPGDVAPAPHGDNIIDIQDYNAMVSCITGIACGNKSLYDLDNNGKVDNRDLDILISHFGESGASFGIPEFTCVTDPQCAKDSTKTIQLCPLKCTKITQNRGF